MSDIARSYIMLVSCLCVLSGPVLFVHHYFSEPLPVHAVWISEDIITVGVCLASVIAATLHGWSID